MMLKNISKQKSISVNTYKSFKRLPFYSGFAKILETFNDIFMLAQLSKTGDANITAISVCVLFRRPMQESLKGNSMFDSP